MATDTKTTKAELKDALEYAETAANALRLTVNELRTSVEDRDLRIAQLHEENLTRLTHAAQLEDALRSTGVQVAQINSDIQTEREAAAQIEKALATDVEDLFIHLRFAFSTLSTITSYGGDDANVLRDLAIIAATEMIELVQRGVESGRYSVEGALSMAVDAAYAKMDVEYVPDELKACDCKDNF